MTLYRQDDRNMRFGGEVLFPSSG